MTSPSTSPTLHVIRGIPVVVENSRPDITTDSVLTRLDEAIELIERFQPWRLRHLRRDLRHIRVVRFPCRGAYIPGDRVCVTELTFLARRDISAAPVASSIVHEGMHARVDRMGVRAEPAIPRVRSACATAELAFESLPPMLGRPVIERARASLDLTDQDVAPAIDWRLAQARQDAVDRESLGEHRPGREQLGNE
jgi:hypothetical protein